MVQSTTTQRKEKTFVGLDVYARERWHCVCDCLKRLRLRKLRGASYLCPTISLAAARDS